MIAVRIVTHAGQAPEAPLSARFDEAGGDIGRSLDCTLVLADPHRRISRRQAQITWRAGSYFIRNVGANLDMEIAGQSPADDRDYPLDIGTEIRIGEYLLRVEGEALRGADDPLALLAPRSTRPGPSAFADLLGNAQPSQAPLSAQEIDLVIGEPTGAKAAPEANPLVALFAGLGVRMPARQSPQQLHELGALLREMIAGTVGLLAARSAAKRELGASQTQMKTRENNLFKFSPDADAALALLLGPPQRGFIAPAAAAHAAFADLHAHQLAVLAGMRAALDAVLERFDPAALEHRFTPAAGLVDSLVPAMRKAALWEQYSARYAEILRESEGDFDTLFGRAFRQAYEAQLAALAGGSEVAAGDAH